MSEEIETSILRGIALGLDDSRLRSARNLSDTAFGPYSQELFDSALAFLEATHSAGLPASDALGILIDNIEPVAELPLLQDAEGKRAQQLARAMLLQGSLDEHTVDLRRLQIRLHNRRPIGGRNP